MFSKVWNQITYLPSNSHLKCNLETSWKRGLFVVVPVGGNIIRNKLPLVNSLWPGDAIYGVKYLARHSFRQWHGTQHAPSHFLNQCWFVDNWTLSKKLTERCQPKCKHFDEEKEFENVVRERPPFSSGLNVVDIFYRDLVCGLSTSDD